MFFTLFIAISTISKAQRHTPGVNGDGDMIGGSSHNSGGYIMQDGWAFALSGGYESPQGDLKEVYKSAPVFGASVRRRMGNLVYSGTLDYRAYQLRQSSFPLTEDGIDYLSATYSKYTGVGAYAGIAYELPVGELLSIYGGANGGFVFTKFSLTAGDGTSTYLSQSASDKVTYLGAKAGFNCYLSNNISLGFEARYTLGAVGANYNSREGSSVTPGFNTFAGNAFLIYQFN